MASSSLSSMEKEELSAEAETPLYTKLFLPILLTPSRADSELQVRKYFHFFLCYSSMFFYYHIIIYLLLLLFLFFLYDRAR